MCLGDGWVRASILSGIAASTYKTKAKTGVDNPGTDLLGWLFLDIDG